MWQNVVYLWREFCFYYTCKQYQSCASTVDWGYCKGPQCMRRYVTMFAYVITWFIFLRKDTWYHTVYQIITVTWSNWMRIPISRCIQFGGFAIRAPSVVASVFLMRHGKKVNNFVIVLIGLTRKQWDFMLKTTQWKSSCDQ